MKSFIYLISLFWLSACTTFAKPTSLSVMQFNVENLFDTKHDDQKDDFTFLPLKLKMKPEIQAYCASIAVKAWREQCFEWDWSEKVLKTKMSRIASVLKQVNQGKGPDLVVMEEVENIEVLERLRKKYLRNMGYQKAILIEGHDIRGIDVGILSKWPLQSPAKLTRIPFEKIDEKNDRDTRGVLEATFALPDGTPLTVLGVHFPAPFHPMRLRIDGLKYIEKIRGSYPPDRLVIALGDFNIPSKEWIENNILDTYIKPIWIAAQEYCKGCKGTTYYKKDKSWSFLDMILLSKSFKQGPWKFNEDSVRVVHTAPEQLDDHDFPKRFEMPGATGVSDHLPLLIQIEK